MTLKYTLLVCRLYFGARPEHTPSTITGLLGKASSLVFCSLTKKSLHLPVLTTGDNSLLFSDTDIQEKLNVSFGQKCVFAFFFFFPLVSTITSANCCQISDRHSATCCFYYLQTYIFNTGNTEKR